MAVALARRTNADYAAAEEGAVGSGRAAPSPAATLQVCHRRCPEAEMMGADPAGEVAGRYLLIGPVEGISVGEGVSARHYCCSGRVEVGVAQEYIAVGCP